MVSKISSRRPGERIARLKAARAATTRYLSLRLEFRRQTTDELLLAVGGEWDARERRYTGRVPSRGAIVRVTEAQLESVRYVAEWVEQLRRGVDRDKVLMLGSKRRGGKTWILVLLAWALALERPGSAVWLVSPARNRRDEIERIIERWIPSRWYRSSKSELSYTLPNGSKVRNLSGAVPEALKQGGAFCVLINEAQEMTAEAASFAVPAVIDEDGIAFFASNPPRRSRGLWTKQLREDLLAQKLAGRFLEVDPALNPFINQPAREKVALILQSILQRAARADAEGDWTILDGEKAYPRWTPDLIQAQPDLGDITREFTRRRYGVAYEYVGGLDFQRWPHQVGVVFKVFGTIDEPIYWAVDEIILVEKSEDEFLDEAFDRGYEPGTILWIGDASGQWQNFTHNTQLPDSFKVFKARRHKIEPPKKKRSDRGLYAGPPRIDDRLIRANTVMAEKRLRVDPDYCPWLAQSFADCGVYLSKRDGRRIPAHPHSHITDAATYLVYWGEPEPRSDEKPSLRRARRFSRPGEGTRKLWT